ncbi:SGNH/GDSL hydrolase family protein [Leifsonia sp. NPDC014704]|uniref:SGNH/GDSL hydrolase family protein n=1 Tax=Leifsonia sp. NPDC014704 TaxID=3364123 RepID=UPI0036F4A6D5
MDRDTPPTTSARSPRRRRARRAWPVAAVLGLAAAAVVIPAQGATATPGPGSYVALGDSYVAGQALDHLTGAYPECLQSAANYPRTAAWRAGLLANDQSCSGATIPDLFAAKGAIPAQTDALSASTQVVTLSIGGNDLGFSAILRSCLAASADGPLWSGEKSCREKYTVGGVDTLSAKAAGVVAPAVGEAVTRIRAKAPNARVVVVGYPTLMPDAAHTPAGGCFSPLTSSKPALPFATTDLDYFHGVQSTLDIRTQAAVRAAGAEYVSLLADTAEHSVCSATPYIDGITLSGFVLSPTSMHPNLAGLGYQGRAVGAVLKAPRDFQGVTGALVSVGGTSADLQIHVPSATLHTTPDIAAEINGSYVANVNGEHGWYVWFENREDTRVYHVTVTVRPGDTVRLRTATGAVQVLTLTPKA